MLMSLFFFWPPNPPNHFPPTPSERGGTAGVRDNPCWREERGGTEHLSLILLFIKHVLSATYVSWMEWELCSNPDWQGLCLSQNRDSEDILFLDTDLMGEGTAWRNACERLLWVRPGSCVITSAHIPSARTPSYGHTIEQRGL